MTTTRNDINHGPSSSQNPSSSRRSNKDGRESGKQPQDRHNQPVESATVRKDDIEVVRDHFAAPNQKFSKMNGSKEFSHNALSPAYEVTCYGIVPAYPRKMTPRSMGTHGAFTPTNRPSPSLRPQPQEFQKPSGFQNQPSPEVQQTDSTIPHSMTQGKNVDTDPQIRPFQNLFSPTGLVLNSVFLSLCVSALLLASLEFTSISGAPLLISFLLPTAAAAVSLYRSFHIQNMLAQALQEQRMCNVFEEASKTLQMLYR